MIIGSVDVGDIVGRKGDVLLLDSYSRANRYTIKVKPDYGPEAYGESIYDESRRLHVCMIDVTELAQYLGSVDVTVEEPAHRTNTARMYTNVKEGWTDPMKGYGTTCVVYPALNGECDVWVADNCDVLNQSTEEWERGPWSGDVVSFGSDYYLDGYIHLRAATIEQERILTQGQWYGEPTGTGVYHDGEEIYEWQGDADHVYSVGNDVQIGTMVNGSINLDGRWTMVTDTADYEFTSVLDRGYRFDMPSDAYHYDIEVRDDCKEEGVMLQWKDSDGATRILPVTIVDAVMTGSENAYREVRYDSGRRGIITFQRSKPTGVRSEIVVGVADVVRGMALEDMMRSAVTIQAYRRNDGGSYDTWEISSAAALLDEEIDYSRQSGDLTMRFAI